MHQLMHSECRPEGAGGGASAQWIVIMDVMAGI